MTYDEQLELTIDLAFQLQLCGAETYRVEESIVRLLEAYGAHGEAFAIPNCIIVSLETQDEQHMTRMRRSAYGSTDLDGVERYNALCRRILHVLSGYLAGCTLRRAVRRRRRPVPFVYE